MRAPDVVEFDLEITYYINKSDANRELEIKAAVEAAVQSYLSWQGKHYWQGPQSRQTGCFGDCSRSKTSGGSDTAASDHRIR